MGGEEFSVDARLARPLALTPHHQCRFAPQVFTASTPQVVANTKEGQYVLTRPATAYKKVFTPLAEKAAIVFEASGTGAVVVGCRWVGSTH